jgi:hypothetical protein
MASLWLGSIGFMEKLLRVGRWGRGASWASVRTFRACFATVARLIVIPLPGDPVRDARRPAHAENCQNCRASSLLLLSRLRLFMKATVWPLPRNLIRRQAYARHAYSAMISPESPISAGKSLNFGSPSRMGRAYPWGCITRSSCFILRSVPSTLVSKVAAYFCGLLRHRAGCPSVPALLTATSRRPKRATV